MLEICLTFLLYVIVTITINIENCYTENKKKNLLGGYAGSRPRPLILFNPWTATAPYLSHVDQESIQGQQTPFPTYSSIQMINCHEHKVINAQQHVHMQSGNSLQML